MLDEESATAGVDVADTGEESEAPGEVDPTDDSDAPGTSAAPDGADATDTTDATETADGIDTADRTDRANHRYYVDTGVGYWTGTFTFAITDRSAFKRARIGLVDRFLVLAMAFLMDRVDEASITSILREYPDAEPAGVVTNEVRITKWRITLYLLRERYVLHPDGRGVTVDSTERFGPVPFLFSTRKAHPAEVVDDGRRAIYYMPLLGTDWVGHYDVEDDGDRIVSELTCDWAVATEVIERAG